MMFCLIVSTLSAVTSVVEHCAWRNRQRLCPCQDNDKWGPMFIVFLAHRTILTKNGIKWIDTTLSKCRKQTAAAHIIQTMFPSILGELIIQAFLCSRTLLMRVKCADYFCFVCRSHEVQVDPFTPFPAFSSVYFGFILPAPCISMQRQSKQHQVFCS